MDCKLNHVTACLFYVKCLRGLQLYIPIPKVWLSLSLTSWYTQARQYVYGRRRTACVLWAMTLRNSEESLTASAWTHLTVQRVYYAGLHDDWLLLLARYFSSVLRASAISVLRATSPPMSLGSSKVFFTLIFFFFPELWDHPAWHPNSSCPLR